MLKVWIVVLLLPCLCQCGGGESSSNSTNNSTGGTASSSSGGGADSGTFNVVVSAMSGAANSCVPRALAADTNTSGRTLVVAAHPAPCTCTGATRTMVTGPIVTAVADHLAQTNNCVLADCQNYCVCQVAVATGDSLQSCLIQADPLPSTVNGWCYIDPAQGVGSTAPLGSCATQKMFRFAGEALPKTGEVFFLVIE